jgi:hypothetical protein
MERRPIPAIVISCHACGLVRIADDYAAASARASAHIHPATHHEFECAGVACTEALRID